MNADSGSAFYAKLGDTYATRSLCPFCLKALPARLERRRGAGPEQVEEIFLCRVCPEHGIIEEIIWRGEPPLSAWHRPKAPAGNISRQTPGGEGCPRDCGRCPRHGQHACTVLFEITSRCNLRCPVCFADAGGEEAPFASLELLTGQLRWIREQAGPVVLQLSGGEPTLYPCLPELVRAACRLFPAVQLNTNGLCLGEEGGRGIALARELALAGLSWVFLQFDGTDDAIFTALRGQPLLRQKLAAIANCEAAGLAVVLVPTVALGVNDHDLGPLTRLALSLAPAVRGVHFQPMTMSGRNALGGSDGSRARLTLPEVLTKLCEQSGGMIRREHATPPGCEHERCSFHCRYFLTEEGALVPLREEGGCCPSFASSPESSPSSSCAAGDSPALCRLPLAEAPACCSPGAPPQEASRAEEDSRENVDRAIDIILRSWRGTEEKKEASGNDAFDRFIAKARSRTFSITCMAFQDAWTADLERLQGCCVHVFAPPGRLIPFCAYNLTSADGVPLHRKKKDPLP